MDVVFERYVRRSLVFCVGLLLVVSLGCGEGCTLGAGGTSVDDKPWPLSSGLASHVPAEAEASFFLRSLRDIEPALQFGAEALTDNAFRDTLPEAAIGPIRKLADRLNPASFGLSGEQSSVLFRHRGVWTLIARVSERKQLDRALEQLVSASPLQMADRTDDEPIGLVYPTDDNETAPIAELEFRGNLVFVRSRLFTEGPPIAGETEKGGQVGEVDRWPYDGRTQKLIEDLTNDGARMVGLIEPKRWLSNVEASGPARAVMQRMANQFGATAVRIDYADEERRLSLDIRSLSDPDEPFVVEQLGSGTGALPTLGGLVEPGVLGVLRLSVDPKSVYRLLVSTMPARQRAQLEAFWKQMRSKLLIDGPEAILDNFTGHAVMVFYGLESESLRGEKPATVRRILELQATREAVLLPIKSRKKAERLLDKMTQLSQGKLSRQRGEHTVQYAWFREGALEWAIILSDEHLIFVDSSTSFDKAMQYERRGRALSPKQLDKMHLGPLLSKRDRSGIYVDTATLANLLSENGYEGAATWLMPIQSLLLTTEMDGEASQTNVDLVLEPGQ